MNTKKDTTYTTPSTKDFYQDCINHSVYIKFDRMHDESWQRITSDKPLSWFLENPGKVTSSIFSVRIHQLRNEDERWESGSHLELNVELRETKQTYLLSIEMSHDHLEYFVSHYSLE